MGRLSETKSASSEDDKFELVVFFTISIQSSNQDSAADILDSITQALWTIVQPIKHTFLNDRLEQLTKRIKKNAY